MLGTTTAGNPLWGDGIVVAVVAGLNVLAVGSTSNSPTGTVSGVNAATVNVTGCGSCDVACKVACILTAMVSAGGATAVTTGESSVGLSSDTSNAIDEAPSSVSIHSCTHSTGTFATSSHNPEMVTPCSAGGIQVLSVASVTLGASNAITGPTPAASPYPDALGAVVVIATVNTASLTTSSHWSMYTDVATCADSYESGADSSIPC